MLILNSFTIFNVCNCQCITAQLSTSTSTPSTTTTITPSTTTTITPSTTTTITPSTTKGNTLMSLI